MIRKLVLPALAAALLGGCVTDYAYRGGDRGDYYYGQPSVEYRYDGGYGPYGYGGYGAGPYGYPYRNYGAPYGYGGYYGPYFPPYYRPYYRRPPVVHPRPDGDPPRQHRRDDRPPWRNLDGLRRPPIPVGPGVAQPPPRDLVSPRAPSVEPRERGGSRMEQVIRRARRDAEPRPSEPVP